jgi:NAD-dependent deacetylase
MEQLTSKIEQAITMITQAGKVVAMTGAGISTPSGIPDFRSPESGIWDHTDPLTVASIYAFRQNPATFYNWIQPMARTLLEAEPNPAHYAMSALEKSGKLHTIITQNIDDLHTKAGSQNVVELHGNLREVTCIQCYEVQNSDAVFDKFLATGQIPYHHCGGVLKPNVILFGEQLPMRELVAAQKAVQAADLMLVVGSSLEVAPASDLPELALASNIPLIIINFHPTYLDEKANLVIRANVAEVLPQIIEGITCLAVSE